MAEQTPSDRQQLSLEVKIPNSLGLHARPAMQLVDLASRFQAQMKIAKGTQQVDAKSIMQVMTLAATQGTKLTLTANGDDASKAIAAVSKLIKEGFGEE